MSVVLPQCDHQGKREFPALTEACEHEGASISNGAADRSDQRAAAGALAAHSEREQTDRRRGARRIKKRWIILLGLVALVGGYFAWVSRPEFGDRAEVTDTCSFPTISNAQYRALVAEAKALIEPKRREIAEGAGNIDQLAPNPPLRDLALEFVKKSQSSEETFVRLFAFGRALDARVHNLAPVKETFPGPGVLWVDRDSADRKIPEPLLRMEAEFQAPPGLFRWTTETWIWARVLGRRYENFWIWLWFAVPDGVAPGDALVGQRAVDAGAKKGLLVWPLNDIRWGDRRLEDRCPDAANFFNYLSDRLKTRKN